VLDLFLSGAMLKRRLLSLGGTSYFCGDAELTSSSFEA
jgi:hypothetical protein